MNTPSHLIITAAAIKPLELTRSAKRWALFGSVAPDVPLYLLSLGGFWYFRQVEGRSAREAFRHIYGYLFFNDPGWIVLHNLLHSPVVLLALIGIIYAALRGDSGVWRRPSLWFCLSCLLHSVIDIFTHHDDGPLFLFPLDWKLRFASPISYWDSNHFGREFSAFELGLDAMLLATLALLWVRDRATRVREPS